MTSLTKAWTSFVRPYETNSPWLYQDTKGRVLVGYAVPVLRAVDAHRLPFLVRSSKQMALDGQITADHSRVRRVPRGKPPNWYERVTLCGLSAEYLAELAETKISNITSALVARIPELFELPEPAQLALVEMATGDETPILALDDTPLRDAVRAREWAAVIGLCARQWIPADRNAAVAALFARAGKQDASKKRAK